MKLPTSKRLEQIVNQLEKYGYVKVQDLSEEFRVSMETIRKDLVYLEEKGLHTICSWNQIDGIITDHTISPKIMERLKGVPICCR